MGAGLANRDISRLKKFFKSDKEKSRLPKTAKQMERHLKGVANHWRIAILLLISEERGISVDSITSSLRGNFKTISDHTRRLHLAGLIDKKYKKNNVLHSLTPYGERFVEFIKAFRNL